LTLAPHFGQRRAFSFCTNWLWGRVLMAGTLGDFGPLGRVESLKHTRSAGPWQCVRKASGGGHFGRQQRALCGSERPAYD
jgi:hypothetical protein